MKNNKKKRLRKCNNGMSPVGINTQYNIPDPRISSGMTRSMDQGWNNSMNSAGQRISDQSSTGSTQSGNIAGKVVSAVGDGMLAWETPELAPLKTSMTTGPLVYEKTDSVDETAEFKKLKKQNTNATLKATGSAAAAGAAIGSVIPGLGTVLGGAIGGIIGLGASIFGGEKREREMKRLMKIETDKIDRKNTSRQASAHTDVLQQEYNYNFEDTTDDVLYNDGKTPFTNGKKANALVGKGETIVDGNTGDMVEVTQGSGIGNDDVAAIVKPQDAIAGNKMNPRTGNTFAEDMKPLTRMESKLKRNTERNIRTIARNTENLVKAYTQPLAQAILADLAMVHRKTEDKSKKKYSWGKVAEYGGAFIQEGTALAPSIYNTIKGTLKADQVRPDLLYSPNTKAQLAINLMSKRRYNSAPEIQQLREHETRQRYNARLLGSDGGINRAMDIAGALNVQRAIGNTYAKKLNIDNTYRGEEAQMMAQLGGQEAEGRTRAMSQSYDINSRNKAMKAQYTAAGLTGMSQYAQMNKKDKNQAKMDEMRMRVLEKYYQMGTTDKNMNYILGGNN